MFMWSQQDMMFNPRMCWTTNFKLPKRICEKMNHCEDVRRISEEVDKRSLLSLKRKDAQTFSCMKTDCSF